MAFRGNEEAKEAKEILVRDRARGEKAFEELLQKKPRDGFIYFERGLGWEMLGELTLALKDYRLAAGLFPLHKWKQIATDRARAVEAKLRDFQTTSERQREGVSEPRVPDWIAPVLSQLAEEPTVGCSRARTLLEQILNKLIENRQLALLPSASMVDKIEAVRPGLQETLVIHMHTIRKLGNAASHGQKLAREDADAVRAALIALVNGLPSELLDK